MSLRRSGRLSVNFTLDSNPGLVPSNDCHDEETAMSCRGRSSLCSVVPAAAAAAGTLKEHVCSYGTQCKNSVFVQMCTRLIQCTAHFILAGPSMSIVPFLCAVD